MTVAADRIGREPDATTLLGLAADPVGRHGHPAQRGGHAAAEAPGQHDADQGWPGASAAAWPPRCAG
jgi:hypothetical protein